MVNKYIKVKGYKYKLIDEIPALTNLMEKLKSIPFKDLFQITEDNIYQLEKLNNLTGRTNNLLFRTGLISSHKYELLKYSCEDLMTVSNIGKKTVQDIFEFFYCYFPLNYKFLNIYDFIEDEEHY